MVAIDDGRSPSQPCYYISSQRQGSDVARSLTPMSGDALGRDQRRFTPSPAAEALDISQQRVRALCADAVDAGARLVLTAADVERSAAGRDRGASRSEETDLRNLWSARRLGLDVLAPRSRNECGDLSPVGLLAEAARKLGQSGVCPLAWRRSDPPMRSALKRAMSRLSAKCAGLVREPHSRGI